MSSYHNSSLHAKQIQINYVDITMILNECDFNPRYEDAKNQAKFPH